MFFLAAAASAAEPYGLNQRVPTGAFLDGRLPPSMLLQTGKWAVVDAFTNLTVDDPTMLIPEPPVTGSAPNGMQSAPHRRLYVSTRQGRILSFEKRADASKMVEFLNLTNVTQGWDDCGLLAFAFHPDFNRRDSPQRYIYVWYHYSPAPIPGPVRPSSFTPGYDRLSRFTVPPGALAADRNSEQVLINQFDHNLWHEGSGMAFGPDGFLYLSISDEGASYDYYRNTQTIRGKMFSGVLRIDVDQNPQRSHPIRRQPLPATDLPAGWAENSYTTNYFIPNDNPFLDPNGGVLEEFWAVGLRNPHRMTLDSATGRFWIGDVGQDTWEEVDVLERSANYQWSYMEGLHPVPNAAKPKDLIGFERPPVFDYKHGPEGNCVIGGYVYRGARYAKELGGRYIFGDNGSGRIWAMDWNGKDRASVEYLCNMPPGFGYTGLSSFGIDDQNELYMLKMGQPSKIYKLVSAESLEQDTDIRSKVPLRISQVHAFTDLAHLAAAPGIIPYGVNSPLWSDGALKQRWISVPGNERITYSATDNFSFPAGTVFIKNFDLTVNEMSGSTRRLETRFLVRAENGGVYGVTYRWRKDGSDADLVSAPVTENIAIATATGVRTQSWYYPGPLDCVVCHNPNAGSVLGVTARQLNGSFAYPTGVTDNQLRTWNHLGLFSTPQDEASLTNAPRLVSVDDTHYSLSDRVRSYLDSNCAQCHRPNGVAGYFDARFSTPLAQQRLLDGPVANQMGDSAARVIKPGDLSKSILYARINRLGNLQMPPLARNLVDTNAVNAVTEWIKSLPRSPEKPLKTAKMALD
ncbi:MAG TPA: PQQ-dependent sugar dehydrogenase [Verrucomicrobiae bacterium]|nr:PQQ-dependent sugar dehydrogenase [Verrucomicrobiae bacterium]